MTAGGQRGWLLLQLGKKEVGDVASGAGARRLQQRVPRDRQLMRPPPPTFLEIWLKTASN
jgi:hypothetical protein